MKRNRSLVRSFFGLFTGVLTVIALLVSFQNCSNVKFDIKEALSTNKLTSNNGSVFDGKPSFYLTRPDYKCEEKLAPIAVIDFVNPSPLFTYNQNDHCGAITQQALDPAEIDQFNFDPNFIGYRDGIYERHATVPDLASPIYNEAWCQSTGTGTDVTVAVKFDSQVNTASSRIQYAAGNNNGFVDYFSVTRGMNDNSADYQASEFKLSVDRTVPAPQKWWYFKGQLETSKIPGGWKGPVLCRMAASRLLAAVQKVYPKNSDWNSYIAYTDSTKNIWSQQDGTCVGAGTWNQCFHGGDKLAVETEIKSCANLIAKDQLDIFNWVCEEQLSGAVFRTNRLKPGRGLSDLITKSGWKQNLLQVYQNGQIRYESIALPWWKNPVVPVVINAPNMTLQLNVPKTVYVIDSNLSIPGIQITQDSIALIVQNGAKVTGNTTITPNCNLTGANFSPDGTTPYPTRCLITGEDRKFLWIEGDFDGTGSNSRAGVNLQRSQFLRLHNVKVRNSAGGFGLFMRSVSGSVFDSIVATGNQYGLVSSDSVGNLFGNSDFSNNGSTGFYLMAWDNANTIVNSKASQNTLTGFSLNSSKDLVLVSNRTVANGVRGFEITGFTENAYFESTFASGDSYGFDIGRTDIRAMLPNIFRNTGFVSRTLGLRVFEGSGANKEVFEGQLYVGNPSSCTIITTPAGSQQSCPGSGLPGSEIYSLPTTRLSVKSSCAISSSGEDVHCQDGFVAKSNCQLKDHLSNPLISWTAAANIPACNKSDVLK